MSRFRPLFLFWLPVVLYSAFIFYLSSQSSFQTSHDKTAHVFAYALLGFLIARAFSHGLSWKTLSILFWGVLIATLYGVSDEIHQHFVPGRQMSGWDVLADFIGSLLGASFYVVASYLQRPSPSN